MFEMWDIDWKEAEKWVNKGWKNKKKIKGERICVWIEQPG